MDAYKKFTENTYMVLVWECRFRAHAHNVSTQG